MDASETVCTGIIFDCDGVVFDSNELKIEAFRKTLSAYPSDIVEAFISYHKQNAGISRYVKFRIFITEFLGEEFGQDKYERLLDSYGMECRALYQQASMTPGSSHVLKEASNIVPLYIASGSDELELTDVFKQRQLSKYFVKILGSPKTKSECVQEALNDIGFCKGVVMVGDAESDWRAAQDAGISFIFMSRYSERRDAMKLLAHKHGFGVIDTLECLKEKLGFKD